MYPHGSAISTRRKNPPSTSTKNAPSTTPSVARPRPCFSECQVFLTAMTPSIAAKPKRTSNSRFCGWSSVETMDDASDGGAFGDGQFIEDLHEPGGSCHLIQRPPAHDITWVSATSAAALNDYRWRTPPRYW